MTKTIYTRIINKKNYISRAEICFRQRTLHL